MPKINKKEDINKFEKEEQRYSKKQIVSSKKFASNKDLLQVLLNDNYDYTLKEVENKINEFKKRRV